MDSKAFRIGGAYAVLAAIATALAVTLREGVPWIHPSPWFQLSSVNAHLASAALGIGAAAIFISATRLAVLELAWARRLHNDLRPVARDLSLREILVVAFLSSAGEELFFRGLLAPTLGVILSAIVFGLAHQIRGPSRWIWASWATVVGLGLGAIFVATGSLVGPLIAHALVNAVNLAYLRDHDPEASRA